jgi:hypothetical protein
MSVQTFAVGSQNPVHMSFVVLQVVPSVSVPIDEKHAATTGGGDPVAEGSTYSHDSPLAQSPAPLQTPWQMLPATPSAAQSLAWQELLELQLLPSWPEPPACPQEAA